MSKFGPVNFVVSLRLHFVECAGGRLLKTLPAKAALAHVFLPSAFFSCIPPPSQMYRFSSRRAGLLLDAQRASLVDTELVHRLFELCRRDVGRGAGP